MNPKWWPRWQTDLVPDYHRDPRVNVRAPAHVQEAAQDALEERGWSLQTYVLAALLKAGTNPDQAVADMAGGWHEPKRPGRPPKGATVNRAASRNAVLWTGDNFDEVQAMRPEARLNSDGDLEVERDGEPGAWTVVGRNYVLHRRPD